MPSLLLTNAHRIQAADVLELRTEWRGDCLFWTGCRNRDGYGALMIGGRYWGAHRLAYALKYGSVPRGAVVRHTCDVPQCVNPAHLLAGTPADNVQDTVDRGRHTPKAGEANGMSKITADQAVAIFHDCRCHKDIAADHGISKTSVFNIKHRKTWVRETREHAE